MEGSLLFWSFIVGYTFAAATIVIRSRPRYELLTLAGVGGTTTALFLFVSRTWASPFQKLDLPTGSGDDLFGVPAPNGVLPLEPDEGHDIFVWRTT